MKQVRGGRRLATLTSLLKIIRWRLLDEQLVDAAIQNKALGRRRRRCTTIYIEFYMTATAAMTTE